MLTSLNVKWKTVTYLHNLLYGKYMFNLRFYMIKAG